MHFQNIAGASRGKGPCLYALAGDPQQNKNVVRQFPREAKLLRDRLESHLGIRIPPLQV